MKNCFLLIALFILIQHSFAQSKDDLYVFDQDWKPTELEKAVYLLIVRPTEEKSYEWIYYNFRGPRIQQETFTDKAGKIRNGECTYYQPDGSIDSTGEYAGGVLNGAWYFRDKEGRTFRRKKYEHGVLIHDTLYAELPRDSVETEDVPGEVESKFKGGIKRWSAFLGQHMQYPQRAMNEKIAGTVVMQFIVDETGSVTHPQIAKSVEYSLDEEALRIIKKSPRWIPASKDGVLMKSYKKQPITFKF